ncbi:unnamed protein product [Pelagomonas calceolata]|uniref:Uncharacterized protein n=2 Tax=Pelagomonas calceolata TaxID=35677 RepID=A0A8J2WLN8_9STRA|nr:unnamed protein product [Pelagomonas calceolata]
MLSPENRTKNERSIELQRKAIADEYGGPTELLPRGHQGFLASIDASNVDDVPLAGLAQEDLKDLGPGDGGRGTNRTAVRQRLRDRLARAAQPDEAGAKEEKRAKLREDGKLDLEFKSLDDLGRKVKWREALVDPDSFELRIGKTDFLARTGGIGGNYWKALSRERADAMVAKAKASGELWRSDRDCTPTDFYHPDDDKNKHDGLVPFGNPDGVKSHYWGWGDADCEAIFEVLLEKMSKEDWALFGTEFIKIAWTDGMSRETKLRGLMRTLSRCLTVAAETTRVHIMIAKEKLEAELRKERDEKLAAEASARRVPLGDVNAVAASAAATCGDARGALPVDDVASAGAALDGDVEMRAVQPAAPRVVAASAFGGAAGGDVPPEKPRADLLDGARTLDALDDPTAGASDDALRSLPSRGLRALAASDASASSQRGAPVASLDGPSLDRGAAESAAFSGSDAPMPPLRRADDDDDDDVDDPLTAAVRNAGAKPKTPEARKALNDLPPGKTPSSCLAALLLRFNLFAVIKGTCTVGGGSMIDDLEELDQEKRKETGSRNPARWYIYKILLFAAQMALIFGDVCFGDTGISIFRCVFGRYALAKFLWLGRKTMLDAMKMRLPLLWVPLEIRPEDLHLLPSWVRVVFPRGLRFESTAVIKELLQRSNGLFFDCKCLLWNATCAGLVGTTAVVPAFALTVAGVDPGSLVATRDATRSRAVVRSSAAGGSSDAVSSLFSAGVDYAAIDFSSFPTCARRGSALLSSQLGSPLSVSVPYFYIRFHKPNSSKLTDWFLVDDFATVMPELNRKYWDPVPDWVFESKTLRALAAGAALIFRGMDIREVAPGPSSLLEVFDPTVECRHNHTYTIWAGVDFVILLPDGRVLDKRLFLLELLKAHAA